MVFFSIIERTHIFKNYLTLYVFYARIHMKNETHIKLIFLKIYVFKKGE